MWCPVPMTVGALPITPDPDAFRAALAAASAPDAWLDALLGVDPLVEDGPDLPRGCVPYLPAPVDALLRVVDLAHIGPHDVVVDVGAGIGRAAALIHLATGASVIAVEVQTTLAAEAGRMTQRHGFTRISVMEGDASQLVPRLVAASVFVFYCPFSGPRLERLLDDLEPLARTRPLRFATIHLPLPTRPWLRRVAAEAEVQCHETSLASRTASDTEGAPSEAPARPRSGPAG